MAITAMMTAPRIPKTTPAINQPLFVIIIIIIIITFQISYQLNSRSGTALAFKPIGS